jgi:hypothetical protein
MLFHTVERHGYGAQHKHYCVLAIVMVDLMVVVGCR